MLVPGQVALASTMLAPGAHCSVQPKDSDAVSGMAEAGITPEHGPVKEAGAGQIGSSSEGPHVGLTGWLEYLHTLYEQQLGSSAGEPNLLQLCCGTQFCLIPILPLR